MDPYELGLNAGRLYYQRNIEEKQNMIDEIQYIKQKMIPNNIPISDLPILTLKTPYNEIYNIFKTLRQKYSGFNVHRSFARSYTGSYTGSYINDKIETLDKIKRMYDEGEARTSDVWIDSSLLKIEKKLGELQYNRIWKKIHKLTRSDKSNNMHESRYDWTIIEKNKLISEINRLQDELANKGYQKTYTPSVDLTFTELNNMIDKLHQLEQSSITRDFCETTAATIADNLGLKNHEKRLINIFMFGFLSITTHKPK